MKRVYTRKPIPKGIPCRGWQVVLKKNGRLWKAVGVRRRTEYRVDVIEEIANNKEDAKRLAFDRIHNLESPRKARHVSRVCENG